MSPLMNSSSKEWAGVIIPPKAPMYTYLLYSGYFLGGKIFFVFVVEKFLPTIHYCIVPGCGSVYCDHENFSMNWPKIHCSRKFYPPKNTRYIVYLYMHTADWRKMIKKGVNH